MNQDIKLLKQCSLFQGLNDTQIESIIKHLSPPKKFYKKGEFLFTAGDKLTEIGIVLSGSVQIIKEDISGNTLIIADIPPCDMFGESFVYSREAVTISAQAAQDVIVMFISGSDILSNASYPCKDYVIANLLHIFAKKNVFLTMRIEHLTKRTLSEKVMSYLKDCSLKNSCNTFIIPFNRQEMADYLAADRSALSSVLSKLKINGYIDFRKNKFTIKRW